MFVVVEVPCWKASMKGEGRLNHLTHVIFLDLWYLVRHNGSFGKHDFRNVSSIVEDGTVRADCVTAVTPPSTKCQRMSALRPEA